MTFTLELPDDLSAQIELAAAQQGISVQDFMIEAARRALDPDAALNALLVSLGGEGENTFDEEEEED